MFRQKFHPPFAALGFLPMPRNPVDVIPLVWFGLSVVSAAWWL